MERERDLKLFLLRLNWLGGYLIWERGSKKKNWLKNCVMKKIITSKAGTSWREGTTSPLLFLCDLVVDDAAAGVCKILANLFCLLLQKFFTSLSVLPGKYVAILAHLFPNSACNSITILSSSAENFTPLLLQEPKTKKLKIQTHKAYIFITICVLERIKIKRDHQVYALYLILMHPQSRIYTRVHSFINRGSKITRKEREKRW